jgi:tetratricopeptide (TPR) repeat protein
MGRCESERQNYQRGLTSFAAALKLLYHQQRPETIAEVYHEIGDTYVAMGDWLQAASLLQTALESSSPTALAFHEPYMRRNLAKAFGMLNQWNQALHHASWAATAFEGRGKHEELGSLYDQIGQAYTHLRDYDDAEQALDNAWYWKEKTQQRGLLWYTRYLEARLYERQNRRLDAKRAYKEADDLLNEANEELSQRFERAIEGLDTWLYERFGSNRTNPTTEEPNAAPAASTQEITD